MVIERLLGTGLSAEFITVFAGVEIDGAGGGDLSFKQHGTQPDSGAKFRRDEDVTFANAPQACHHCCIFEKNASLFNVVGKLVGGDLKSFLHPFR